jgi:hypothetical protein
MKWTSKGTARLKRGNGSKSEHEEIVTLYRLVYTALLITAYKIKINQETLEKERVCTAVSNIKTGYSIKFSAKMADELHKLCVDEPSEYSNNQVTSYPVQRGDNKGPGNLVSVKSYKDLRDAEDIEELFRFGHIANPEERQLLAEEKAGRATPPNMIPRPYG